MKTVRQTANVTGRRLRQRRVRSKIRGSGTRPRLSVFRSNRYFYVQLVDDAIGRTMIGLRRSVRQPELVGKQLAARAKAKKIKEVVFDRAGYRYVGKLKTLAEAARRGGLVF